MTSIAQVDLAVNRSPVRPNLDALQAANQRLLARRREQANCPDRNAHAPVDVTLPTHIGWGNARLSLVKHSPAQPRYITAPCVVAEAGPTDCPTPAPANLPDVCVSPSILLAMLRTENVAAGRIWLLCRHLDQNGRGWLPVDKLRDQLCTKGHALRVCGWRRLRQILAAGQGIFWQRDENGRVWLRSAEKVAALLHVKRLEGTAIKLSIQTLTQPIRIVRAHFFASFHSGRKNNQPISRETLAQLSGVAERTQRQYDRVTQTHADANIAVGGVVSAETRQSQSYRRRHGSFILTDQQGKQGRAGQQYYAWRLPNHYRGVHETVHYGRQKKINRRLKQQHTDLVNNRAQGNSEHAEQPTRLFFDGGRFRPNVTHDTYWFDPQHHCWRVIEPTLDN